MNREKTLQQWRDAFEWKKRDSGDEFMGLNHYTAPQELYGAVRKAHDERLPDDWIYKTCYRVIGAMCDHDVKTADDMEEHRAEIVDGLVDIYTSDLTAWLNDSIYNVSYIDDAMSEHEPKTGCDLLMMAQYRAIDEIYSVIAHALEV